MVIQYTVKSVYGKDNIYPVNDMAKTMSTLLGQKTLTQRDLQVLQTGGFVLEQVK